MNNKIFIAQEDLHLKPSQVLIDNWKLWMAKEVVVQFKTEKKVKLQLKDILTLVEFKNFDALNLIFAQFMTNLLKAQENCQSTEDLEEVKITLDKLFKNNILKKLNTVGINLRNNCNNKLQEYLSSDLQIASPYNLMIFFKDVSKIFLAKRRKYEKSKVELIHQKKSANQAYINLLNINNYKSESKSIWKALILYYKLHLNIYKIELFNKIILDLINIIQAYYDTVNQTFLILEEVEKSLNSQTSMPSISTPVFSYLNLINIDKQQNFVDQLIGHKINYWGDKNLSSQQLENIILSNVEDLAIKVFLDFKIRFIDNLVVNK